MLRANQAAEEIHAWRLAHGVQAKLHDLGVTKSAYLLEREAIHRDAERTRLEISATFGPVQEKASSAWREASQRITQEVAPARDKVAELRKLLTAAYERERLAREFEQLARDRAAGRATTQDTSPDWQAMAPKLRRAIDAYNRQSPELQAAIMDRLSRTSALEKSMGAEFKLQRSRVRDRDQGLSL
jgi:hypothetical protein